MSDTRLAADGKRYAVDPSHPARLLPEAPPGLWREPDEDELRGDTIPAPPPTEPQATRVARASELGNRLGFHRFTVPELRLLADQLGDLIDAAERVGGVAIKGPFYAWLRMSEARAYMQLAVRAPSGEAA